MFFVSLGKSSRFPLSRVETSRLNVLNLIYSDIWGPTPVFAKIGYRYFVVFVDNLSRLSWLYPLRLKSYIYVVFERFPARSNLSIMI